MKNDYTKPSRKVSTTTTYIISTKRGRLLPNEEFYNGVTLSTIKKYILQGTVPYRRKNSYGEVVETIHYPISDCLITKKVLQVTTEALVEPLNPSEILM